MKVKEKVKVWVDADTVIKVAEVPKRDKWIIEVMEEVPKGEKSK